MSSWYKVTKKINGRLYDYWQRTFRVGGSVKTENKYIGPASRGATPISPMSSQEYRDYRIQTFHEEAMATLNPFHGLDNIPTIKRALKETREQERREDERIQYGPRAARIRKQEAAVRKAKRETKGIKSVNPFLAKALKP